MQRIKTVFPYLLITLLVAILFWKNYVPGTWLTGWDNLHTEFDFKTNIIDRGIFSTWQQYQGLGVRAGNAHAADLLRQIGLYITSLILPSPLLRYFYHFFALLAGAIGAYELMRRKIIKSTSLLTTSLASLLGAIFYILNLGTMQYFYVPYEAFSHFFASLPWLILGLFTYLDHPTKKTFLVLSLVHLLAIPMNYIPTIFVVYMLIVSIVLAWHILHTRRIRSSFVVLATLICINAYWLFPFTEFVRNGTDFVTEAKINRLFTQEAFLRNQEFGTWKDLPLLKGFLFDTTDLVDNQGTHEYMMRPWMDFLSKPISLTLHYILFGLIVIGYILSLTKKQPKNTIIVVLFGLGLFAMINDNKPTGILFSLLQQHAPFFKQIFRFPFTKFAPIVSLTYAIGFAYFWRFAFTMFHKPRRQKILQLGIFCIPLLALVYINRPSFSGNFIYAQLRKPIPQEYFDLFAFFKKQDPNGKIANLPQPTFWGWTSYDWGYRGSGFPWYGIRQPILDRAFDVWNSSNERYYQDLSTALYTQQTPEAVEKIFDTYRISYAWLDERIILPHKPSSLLVPEIKKFLSDSRRFEKIFESGKQTVYRFVFDGSSSVQTTTATAQSYYPLREFFYQRPVRTTEIKGNGIEMAKELPRGTLSIPPIASVNGPILYSVLDTKGPLRLVPSIPSLVIGTEQVSLKQDEQVLPVPSRTNNQIFTEINGVLVTKSGDHVILYPKNNTYAVYSQNPQISQDISPSLYDKELHNCAESSRSSETIFGKQENETGVLTLFGTFSRPCVYHRLADLFPAENKPYNINRALLGFRLEYKPTSTEKPSLCLSQEGETSCFYQSESPIIINTDQKGWNTGYFLVPIGTMDIQNVWIKLELQADDRTGTRRISYRKLQSELLTNPLSVQSFERQSSEKTQTLQVKSSTNVSLFFPQDSFPQYTINPTLLNKSKKNCASPSRGTFDKKIQEDPSVGSYIEYEAYSASSCDSIPFFEPLLTTGIVTSITSRNVSGRPIKTCLAIDPPGYCLFEDIVPIPTNTWSTVTYLSPSIQEIYPYQFYLELDNYAVGQEKRVNQIANITFTSVPAVWLSSISLKTDEKVGSIEVSNQTEPTTNFTVSHPNPALYQIQLPTMNDEPKTLILYQSFDPGWKAYKINCKLKTVNCKLAEFFPFLFGREMKDHVLVNNWANGWRVAPKSASGGDGTIVIFFLPQLLQWFGFLLLPLPFLAALRIIIDTKVIQ